MSETERIPTTAAPDAGAIAGAVMERLGPGLGALVTEAVQAKVKELGLDRVDRKAGVFPGVEGAGVEQPDGRKRLASFLRAAIFGPGNGAEAKALAESSSADGGYLVPTDFRSEVIRRTNELSVLYPRAFRFTTSLASVKAPALAADVEVSWDEAENENLDETTPVFGQKSFTIHRMNAITHSSRELLGDASVNLVDLLAQLFAEATSRERDKVICAGDGATQPEGIFSATGVATVSAIGTLTYDKLLQLDEAIADPYRGEASLVWIGSQAVRRVIRGLSDENKRPLLEPALQRGAPMTLLDHPFLVNKNVPAGSLALGVMSKYWIADREQMGFESTTTGGDAFRKHQVAVKIWERWDGRLVFTTDCWVIGTGITV
ncbi:MAG TPA: phage major capsid protein [Candidatus Brocadiia bacterium]|nr:phage major capsid protein [Candidatus Brocadiia bacterium]